MHGLNTCLCCVRRGGAARASRKHQREVQNFFFQQSLPANCCTSMRWSWVCCHLGAEPSLPSLKRIPQALSSDLFCARSYPKIKFSHRLSRLCRHHVLSFDLFALAPKRERHNIPALRNAAALRSILSHPFRANLRFLGQMELIDRVAQLLATFCCSIFAGAALYQFARIAALEASCFQSADITAGY